MARLKCFNCKSEEVAKYANLCKQCFLDQYYQWGVEALFAFESTERVKRNREKSFDILRKSEQKGRGYAQG